MIQFPYGPNTNAIVDAIVAYLSIQTLPDGQTLVYNAVQKGEFKDVTDNVGNGRACGEVYGNIDDSQRHASGGVVREMPSFFILSISDLTHAANADTIIYNTRDAIVPLFVGKHVQLGMVPGVMQATYKQGSGKYMRTFRNGQWWRCHIMELQVTSQWMQQDSFQS